MFAILSNLLFQVTSLLAFFILYFYFEKKKGVFGE
jgi:hypothetical protein